MSTVTEGIIQTIRDSGRKQPYKLRGMTPYLQPGERFKAGCQFIAGMPKHRASLSELPRRERDPRALLQGGMLDQYVAAKALGVMGSSQDIALLRKLYDSADDHRVSLESAGSMAKLGAREGLDRLLQEVQAPRIKHLRMEAVLLLPEFGTTRLRDDAAAALAQIATGVEFSGDEIRQAAIWGLGCTGLCDYSRLIPLLDAKNENERIHAVVTLGRKLPATVVDSLIGLVGSDETSQQQRASCIRVS